MSQVDESSKWAGLLQPIKELEKNWDIDIAGELTDYLEELTGLTFTVDGLSNLNFAEAAIVVYGSSCTYGKKVEYLLKLTVAALETSRSKHKESQAERRRKDGHTEQCTALLGFVDLLQSVADSGYSNHTMDIDSLSQLDVPEPEAALLAQVSQAVTMRTVAHKVGHGRNDGMAQQSKAAAMSATDAPSFNMLKSCQHISGALLLMQCDGEQWNQDLVSINEPTSGVRNTLPQQAASGGANALPHPTGFGSPMEQLDSRDCPPGLGAPFIDEPEISLAGDIDYGNDDDGASNTYRGMEQPDCPRPSPGQGNNVRASAEGENAVEDVTAPPDPYAEADPHCPDTANDKPYKRMVPKEPTFNTSVKQSRWHAFEVQDDFSDAEARLRILLPRQLREQPKRTERRRAPLEAVPSPLRPGPVPEPHRTIDPKSPSPARDGLCLEVGHGEHDDTPQAFAYDDAGDDFEAGPLCDTEHNGVPPPLNLDFMEGPENSQGLTYEELLLQYSAAVSAASVEFAQSTLSQKVSTWRDNIGKIMAEQDQRPTFDIQHIGAALVDSMKKKGKGQECMSFGDIVQCENKYEVARCFSAFLQQVNNETVELLRGDTPASPFFVKIQVKPASVRAPAVVGRRKAIAGLLAGAGLMTVAPSAEAWNIPSQESTGGSIKRGSIPPSLSEASASSYTMEGIKKQGVSPKRRKELLAEVRAAAAAGKSID